MKYRFRVAVLAAMAAAGCSPGRLKLDDRAAPARVERDGATAVVDAAPSEAIPDPQPGEAPPPPTTLSPTPEISLAPIDSAVPAEDMMALAPAVMPAPPPPVPEAVVDSASPASPDALPAPPALDAALPEAAPPSSVQVAPPEAPPPPSPPDAAPPEAIPAGPPATAPPEPPAPPVPVAPAPTPAPAPAPPEPPPVDAGAPVDAAPERPANLLLVDDFSDANPATSTMGGVTTSDNQLVAVIGGELRFAWTGKGQFQDFIEAFRPNWCGFDLRPYRTLRFRMRASAANKSVRVYLGQGNAACATVGNPVIRTVTLGTTTTTHDVDLSALVRDKAKFVEWSPVSLDATEYFLDDVQLVP